MTEKPFSFAPGNESESLDDWWSKVHEVAEPFWLTGSQGPEVWYYLRVADLLRPAMEVLNIGVGLGNCTRNLAAQGTRVSVLDISPLAIERVKNVIQSGYLADRLEALPDDRFDLAISNLVAQHMPDTALASQIAHVVRSLKPTGLFAMQFTYRWGQSENTLGDDPVGQKSGAVSRTLARMAEIVQGAGGTITWAQVIGHFGRHKATWYGLHIVKPSGFGAAIEPEVHSFDVPGQDSALARLEGRHDIVMPQSPVLAGKYRPDIVKRLLRRIWR